MPHEMVRWLLVRPFISLEILAGVVSHHTWREGWCSRSLSSTHFDKSWSVFGDFTRSLFHGSVTWRIHITVFINSGLKFKPSIFLQTTNVFFSFVFIFEICIHHTFWHWQTSVNSQFGPRILNLLCSFIIELIGAFNILIHIFNLLMGSYSFFIWWLLLFEILLGLIICFYCLIDITRYVVICSVKMLRKLGTFLMTFISPLFQWFRLF